MNQDKLSKWLKVICVLIAIVGAGFYLWLFPLFIEKELNNSWYWLIVVWVSAIPCYLALGYFWKICSEIGNDNSFSNINAKYLKRISELALIDSIVVILGNILITLIDKVYIEILIIFVIIILSGIGISLIAATLSHLVYKANKIKKENELTI
jgi:hypothetical protein